MTTCGGWYVYKNSLFKYSMYLGISVIDWYISTLYISTRGMYERQYAYGRGVGRYEINENFVPIIPTQHYTETQPSPSDTVGGRREGPACYKNARDVQSMRKGA